MVPANSLGREVATDHLASVAATYSLSSVALGVAYSAIVAENSGEVAVRSGVLGMVAARVE